MDTQSSMFPLGGFRTRQPAFARMRRPIAAKKEHPETAAVATARPASGRKDKRTASRLRQIRNKGRMRRRNSLSTNSPETKRTVLQGIKSA